MTHAEIEEFIRQTFEENFQRLQTESGHSLSPDAKEEALRQVVLYWHKLQSLAETITDTEVSLNLPNQTTPNGRTFGIEGVVDIVREAGRTTMYDIKTHDLEFVQANRDFYQKQLNVYAHIWQNLRGEALDETAIISTSVPDSVRRAMRRGDFEELQDAMDEWDPVVPLPFDGSNVDEMIHEFGEVVDGIEDGQFETPAPERLKQREFGNKAFGNRVCGNCDARFSCRAYQEYARAPRRRDSSRFAKYFSVFSDEGGHESWRYAVADDLPNRIELEGDA